MPDASLTARVITDDEYDDWIRVVSTAFGGFPEPAEIELNRQRLPLERTIGAFVAGDLVGTAGSYGFDMTVPGGETIPVAGVTAVGVLGTHRRRGALRTMVQCELDATADRGEAMSILNASESGIYGRFGYGLAQQYQTLQLDADRASFVPDPPAHSLRLVARTDALDVIRPIFDAYRLTRAGEVSRNDAFWGGVLGEHEVWEGGGKFFLVVADPAGDDPGGYAIYTMQDQGQGLMKRLVVRELAAASPETEAALWRYCVELDLVGTVEMTSRPLDDPIRFRLTEPRQLQVIRQSDYLWVRLLDVPASLSARAYGTDDEIVIEVRDSLRPDVGGRFRLHGSPKGGECDRTTAPAELDVTVADLGAMYLGGVNASTLARAGRVTELRPGALELADELFGSALAPHCSTRF
jgi:predicted acetyltransferase